MSPRVISFAYGIFLASFLYSFYWGVSMFGFPDGYKTTYQLAVRKPYFLWIAFNAVITTWFIFNLPGIRKTSGKVGLFALAHLVICLLGFWLIHYYYRIHLGLEDGEAG